MNLKEFELSKIKKKYLKFLKSKETKRKKFKDKIGQLKNFYIPLCDYIYNKYNNKTLIIGLSGGQGAGKTTMAEIIKIILKGKYNLETINFSIDDYYKTLKERKILSRKTNKLFLTRGVPGTHQTNLLLNHINILKGKKFKKIKIPKFNKSIDDRSHKSEWTTIKKKPNIVIFEGWCLGAKSQTKKKLLKPVNLLEKNYDMDLTWRSKVNNELKKKYKKIFNSINFFVFLKVPSFKYVLKWRIKQEKDLKLISKGKKIMSVNEINKFVMFYERITKEMISYMPKESDITINLDKKHNLKKLFFLK